MHDDITVIENKPVLRVQSVDMEGFHTQVCYGDYLREVGYALKKLGKVEWENISEDA